MDHEAASKAPAGDLKTAESDSSLQPVQSAVVGEAETHHLPTYEHEKRLALKFDLRILPVIAFMYLCKYVPQNDLGNFFPIPQC